MMDATACRGPAHRQAMQQQAAAGCWHGGVQSTTSTQQQQRGNRGVWCILIVQTRQMSAAERRNAKGKHTGLKKTHSSWGMQANYTRLLLCNTGPRPLMEPDATTSCACMTCTSNLGPQRASSKLLWPASRPTRHTRMGPSA